ncbi:putative signal peptidase complex subunit 2 [Zostera marina]|uniref:Signal peptidase complex subunit 2 n=1 Tax=Zostera marina TaxID=29655 RepID=A0A0K9PJN2_ZOSMR|nr:putative signal peptidase complex subunit 2 [Zostera marina]
MAATQGEKGDEKVTVRSGKKTNLLDHHSIKNLLDESVGEVVKEKGFIEDVRLSNKRLALGLLTIVVGLVAQFYNKKFPQNKDFLLTCIALYIVLNIVLLLVGITKGRNAILFTYPLQGSFNSTGLVVSSKLSRFSDLYTLTISSADVKSISAKKPVHLTKSVTKWFTKDGVLVEGLFWKDVVRLIDDYSEDRKSR